MGFLGDVGNDKVPTGWGTRGTSRIVLRIQHLRFKDEFTMNKFTTMIGFALLLGLSTGVVATMATPAQAQATRPMQRANRGDRLAQELSLTPEQRERIRQIRESAKQQMQAILTPEQRAQLETARQQGQRPQRLNLTEQQRQQMQQIRESTRQQVEAVLTPEQRARAEQLRQQRQQRRQQRFQGQPSGVR